MVQFLQLLLNPQFGVESSGPHDGKAQRWWDGVGAACSVDGNLETWRQNESAGSLDRRIQIASPLLTSMLLQKLRMISPQVLSTVVDSALSQLRAAGRRWRWIMNVQS